MSEMKDAKDRAENAVPAPETVPAVGGKQPQKIENANAKKAEATTSEVNQSNVKVRNITKVNIFTSIGKIEPGAEDYVTPADAKALKDKKFVEEV